MRKLFDIFRNSKAAWRGSVEGFWPFTDSGVVSCTFLNHYSLHVGTKSGIVFSMFDYIFADGALLAAQISRAVATEIPRVSFDLSSVAKEWLGQAGRRGYKVIFVGGRSQDAFAFSEWIKANVPELMSSPVSVRNGFSGINAEELARELEDGERYFIVFGLGTPRQENCVLDLVSLVRSREITVIATTCGGFITQTAISGGDFYPRWIDMFGLRWLWRCYKQPYVVSRLLQVYPQSYLMVREAISKLTR